MATKSGKIMHTHVWESANTNKARKTVNLGVTNFFVCFTTAFNEYKAPTWPPSALICVMYDLSGFGISRAIALDAKSPVLERWKLKESTGIASSRVWPAWSLARLWMSQRN